MKTNLRTILLRLTGVMGAIVILAFVFVLVKGTLGFSPISNAKRPDNEVTDDLAFGETALRRGQGGLLWVSRLSDTQSQELANYPSTVVQQGVGCELGAQFCVLSAETGQTGIQLRFTQPRPAQIPVELPWSGGFVNPANGAVYDLLGRAYRFQGDVKAVVIVAVSESAKPN